VDEEAYTFHAKTYIIFSWLDERAPDAMKESTEDMIENNGTCDKPCSGQRMLEGDPTAGTCCTKVWAPAALFRNVKEVRRERERREREKKREGRERARAGGWGRERANQARPSPHHPARPLPPSSSRKAAPSPTSFTCPPTAGSPTGSK
jgi:hypothetical protein